MTKTKQVTTVVVGLLTSLLAFLGIVSCCGLPLIATFLAWLGIGASQLSFFSEYKSVFTTTAIIALIYGFYTVYIQKKADKSIDFSNCNDENEANCCSSQGKSNHLVKILLWISVVALITTFSLDAKTKDPVKPIGEIPRAMETSREKTLCCGTDTIPLKPISRHREHLKKNHLVVQQGNKIQSN